MIYDSYLPRAIKVAATAIAPPLPVDAPGNSGRRNLTAFGATDKAGQVVSLRFVNDNNVSVAITLVFAGGWLTNNASAAGKVAVSLPYVQNQPVSMIIASIFMYMYHGSKSGTRSSTHVFRRTLRISRKGL